MSEDGQDAEKSLSELDSYVQPLLTDFYQINMAYAYWKSGKIEDMAVFDLFFRKNPFGGEFTIFAGLEQCLSHLKNFKFSSSDIDYLKGVMDPSVDSEFFDYLQNLTVADVILNAVEEGEVVFPRVPFLTVEGPLIAVQLLETTLLNLVNYASLIATNAARFRLAAGSEIKLMEFGLRRAQGPNGGMAASKYAYIGGFDSTSNVLAGKMFGIPIVGTHAHSFVMAYSSLEDANLEILINKESGEEGNLKEISIEWRKKLAEMLNLIESEASDGEFAAFISFAASFSDHFLALVDTYDVLKSGLLNFCSVALALHDLGYKAVGIRIDSGDLSFLSIAARDVFTRITQEYSIDWFEKLTIVASNDINEESLLKLNKRGHQINSYGIGTHLVTCQKQPALGCVFKLVEINDLPKIKLSQDVEKVTIPGKKKIYRLYGDDGCALVDLMQTPDETPPEVDTKVLCRHPFQESRRVYITPSKVEELHKIYWSEGEVKIDLPTIQDIREKVKESMKTLRMETKQQEDSKHKEYINRVLVAVSDKLYKFLHELWLENAPIGEIF